jgi:hypothetical protein
VPLASAECWAVAYALLGRPEKAERLFGHAARSPDPEAVGLLVGQPLPAPLAKRVAALA